MLLSPKHFYNFHQYTYFIVNIWGYNWGTLSLGDIDIEPWSSGLGVGYKTDDLALKKLLLWNPEIQRIGNQMSLAESSQEYLGHWWWWYVTEYKGKLTLLKKIFSGVVVLQDVCWDTVPQCWTVHPQLLDFHLSTESYGWISQCPSHLEADHLYQECCSHCHGETGTERTDKEHHNLRWNLHHHLEWRNLFHVKEVKLILHERQDRLTWTSCYASIFFM